MTLPVYISPSTITTLYVRPAGTTYGSGDGSSYENALSGFSAIVWGSVAPGTRIIICGTHAETLSVNTSGTEELPIVIQAEYPGVSGIIDCANLLVRCFYVHNRQYINIEGLVSKNATESCFETSGFSSNIVYYNCVGDTSGNQAWQSTDTASATYYDISGFNCVDDGFSMHDATTAVIYGGTFADNAQGINIIADATLTGYSINLNNNTEYDVYVTLQATNVSAALFDIVSAGKICCYTGNLTLDRCVISGWIVSGVGGVTNIYRSLFTGSAATGHIIDFEKDSGNGILAYNIFSGIKSSKFAIAVRAGVSVEVYNNVIVGVGNIGEGIFCDGAVIAKNNIIVDVNRAFAIGINGGLSASNNCLFGNTTDFHGAGSQTDGVLADPLFIDKVSGIFQLQSTSPCINTGVSVGLTSDIVGNPFYGLPDIGAYEYQYIRSIAPITTPGPLRADLTVTAGTTYPNLTVTAPLGPEFQAIPEWTGGAAVDLNTLVATANTRIGGLGVGVWSTALDIYETATADEILKHY